MIGHRTFQAKSRRKYWIFFFLVFLACSFVMWKIGKSQNYVQIIQNITESEFVAPDRRFLIDLRDFDYVINQKSCRQLRTQPKFIVLIHSAPRKRENRDNIRQSWGGWKVDHRVLFLLGTVESQDLQREIQTESDFFQDIVQGNFVDTYRNLSYKHVMAMKWATEFCPETKFIFKSDDDVFVNTALISQYIQRMKNPSNFITCDLYWPQKVLRETKSKWYVSPEEYPNATYPVYCPGCGVLLTSDVAQKLHKAAETTPFFWVDDVYVLGILREKINARITAVDKLLLKSRITDEIFYEKTRNITDCLNYMYSLELQNDQIKELWQVVKKYQENGYYTVNATKLILPIKGCNSNFSLKGRKLRRLNGRSDAGSALIQPSTTRESSADKPRYCRRTLHTLTDPWYSMAACRDVVLKCVLWENQSESSSSWRCY
ncbi:UDP-GalNAc:beta-1,3-N-acetylgalactosaminyltransferase 1-like [Phlebotomus argentipes]|uniref:UDP-GalNAc:beta-1, 3-N-acetylgalactosaminyltransferase 1-like n=1 Tax=Phlebotomus argentipes TaxID=94469 RepID=UPI002892B17F|nr:UDP-GalNAc:beta-1,3-N-acetylgalactosaminyltransferase 1-like [Phlebotomus argentipes]